nr:MAG: hypothetical protein DIU78_06295 [Pseudomonadota bacterium]
MTARGRERARPFRWLWIPMLVVCALVGEARAEPSAQTSACVHVEEELAAARLELERVTTALRTAETRAAAADALRVEIERATRALEEREAAARSCEAARNDLCTAARRFAEGIAAGQVETTGLRECLDPADRQALVARLSGWSNASSTLGDFVAYATGESDRIPSLGPSSGSMLERRLARLFATGNGTPLVFRRLLVEAMEQVAPRALATLKAKPGQLDRWFSSDAPLDDAIVQEAHEGAAGKSDGFPRGALAKALGLVDAYRIVARCDGPSPARACHRARQLAQMLESSGPLVLRRRMQDVWATECSSLTDTVVHGWLTDLPKGELPEAQVEALVQTVHAKLVTCFLRDSAAGSSFSAWVATKLPAPKDLTASTLARFVELERLWQPGSPTDRCVRAVRTLQTLPAPSECSAPSALVASVEDWLAAVPAVDRSKASFELGVCDRLARALFRGENASIPDHFPAPPTIEDAVRLTPGAPPSNMQQLRAFCRDRVGQGEAFVTALRTLGRLGKALGESPALPPWNLDATTLLPIELGRIGRSEDVSVWLRSLLDEDAACSVLELGSERCRVCRERSDESLYDCGLLQGVRTSWATRTRSSVLSLSLLAGFGGLLVWGVRLRRAEIGVEGVRAALERAESEGSPLRVWVESEIAEPTSPGGAVLRTLAAGGVERPHELRRIAARVFRDQFAATGVARTLSPGEADRRAEEAAGVVVRTLGESGLLRAHGDPTEPEGYELPDGIIRRILRSSASSSGV